jgi:hypothetical protein
MSSPGLYLLFGAAMLPLWWPALRLVISEISAAGEAEPTLPSGPGRTVAAPQIAAWRSTRARRAPGHHRWEGGFGRRMP